MDDKYSLRQSGGIRPYAKLRIGDDARPGIRHAAQRSHYRLDGKHDLSLPGQIERSLHKRLHQRRFHSDHSGHHTARDLRSSRGDDWRNQCDNPMDNE